VLEGQREREQALVLFVELVADRLQALLLKILQINFDRQTQTLTVVAKIESEGRDRR